MKPDPRFAKLTGSGETTVIIDTGLNDISSYFRPGEVVYQYDFADNTSSVVDTLGHGSNIASIIGSNNSQYPGLAPDANLIILKVFDNSGHGYFSYVDEALQWAATNAATYHIGVVNMSLGDGGNWIHAASRYGMGAALSQLAAENVITVAAAGNSYYYYQTIGLAYPGSDPSVLAVGSVWPGNLGGPWNYSDGSANYTTAADQFAVYSQRDPNLAYALAPGGVFTGAGVGGGSTSEQGTSQASAYMAGAATLAQELAQQVLGRQLNVVEFAHLLSLSGDTVVDSANGASNVTPTGLSYSRLNFVKLFSAIEAMNGVTPTPPTTPAPPASGGSAGSSASASGFATVQVSEGQAVSGVNFSNFLAGSIAGTVFLDTNGGGTRQIAETGLSGITVFLDTAGTGVLTAEDPQTLTDSTGHYSFAGLTAGSYTIREVVPAGDLETTPDPVTVTMTSGLAATENFGLFAAGTISGTVFRDANVNGTLNTGETGIAGRTVFIDKAGTGLVAAGDPQAVTDNSGHYSFTGIGPGTYVVREVVTVDVTETSPDSVAVTMMSGLLSTVNFGLTYKGPTFSATGGSTATIGQTYSIALSATDPLHTIREWYIDWGDGTLQGIVGNPSIATHTYQSGGTSYVIAASVMDDIGLYDASPFSIAVGAPLQVTSVTPNVSGVAVRFNHTIDPTTIHLYDSAAAPLGAPDVTLVGARVGAVAGSIVFDADLKGFTFIATGGPLAADNYTLKLLSGTLAFHDTIGALDGAGTGVPGSANATATFAKAANAGATISLPDFVRAPGQSVDYAVGGHGVPLTLTNATGLTSLGFHIDYNPALLTITGIAAGSVPAGMTLTVNVTIPGHAVFLLSSAHPLGAGALSVGAFSASVPSSAVYGTRQILRLGVDSVVGGTAVADNALEVVGLLGDTNGNGKYDAQDALLVQRVIVKADSGFSAWPDVDPVILADVARHGSLVTIDATRIAQEAVTHARPEFPIPPTTLYAADPKVLQSGLSPTIMAAANLAPESLASESLASANLATPLLTDGVMLGDGTDPTQMGIQADPMRIKLAKRFSDFSLSGAAGNAAWKGDFLTTIGHSSANAIASIRLTI